MQAFDNNWFGFIIADRGGKISKPIGDGRVRQALNYAIDREAMLTAFANGKGKITGQVFNPGSPSFDAALDDRFPYDPKKARALLAAAGYPNGFDIKMPSTSALASSVYDLVKQQLKDVGIRVTFEDLQINDYFTALINGKYAVSMFALQFDPTDWQISQFEIDKSSTWNGLHTDDPKVQGYIHTLQVGTPDEAKAAGKDLNKYIVEQAWFGPWLRPSNFFATKSNTKAALQVGNSYPYLENIVPK